MLTVRHLEDNGKKLSKTLIEFAFLLPDEHSQNSPIPPSAPPTFSTGFVL